MAYKHYLQAIDKFQAQLALISDEAVDAHLREATAKNLLAFMKLRGIPISRYPEEVDLFTFVIAFDQLILQSTLNTPIPSKEIT